MPQQEYSSLTKSQKRQLTDPRNRDIFIDIKPYPRLGLRFNQIKFKTPKHGPIHGLPVNDKGKTSKTEENTIRLPDILLDISNIKDFVWYIY